MKRVLVDSDVLINFLRGREKARTFLSSLIDEADILCSAVSVAEIHAGMKEPEAEKTEELLDGLIIVDINREIAAKAGRYLRTIHSQKLSLDDCLIAATAHAQRAVLATGNKKHYPMTDIEILVVPIGN